MVPWLFLSQRMEDVAFKCCKWGGIYQLEERLSLGTLVQKVTNEAIGVTSQIEVMTMHCCLFLWKWNLGWKNDADFKIMVFHKFDEKSCNFAVIFVLQRSSHKELFNWYRLVRVVIHFRIRAVFSNLLKVIGPPDNNSVRKPLIFRRKFHLLAKNVVSIIFLGTA